MLFFSYINITTIKTMLLKEAISEADKFGETIIKTTHYEMLENRRERAYEMIQKVGTLQGIDHIRMINKSGKITFSTEMDEIGRYLDKKEADRADSIKVVQICTEYAQKGMWNIFVGLLSLTLAFALFDPYFFIAYLIAIATFGLFQAMFMANAGGSWDNAKKVVEVDLGEKNTPLHAATVIGDTVGDPFKDTTSVSLNPIIKFSTLFGMLAVEIAIKMNPATTRVSGAVFFIVGLIFVWRSFYKMRIPKLATPAAMAKAVILE